MRTPEQEKEFKKACQTVENACRSLGRNCQVQFLDDGVTVAPPSWPGESSGMNLYEALEDAEGVE